MDESTGDCQRICFPERDVGHRSPCKQIPLQPKYPDYAFRALARQLCQPGRWNDGSSGDGVRCNVSTSVLGTEEGFFPQWSDYSPESVAMSRNGAALALV